MIFLNQFIIFCVFFTGVLTGKSYPNQPKLSVIDGHLHVIVPENKNVQFYTSSFHVNDYELLSTLKGAENASKVLQNYERFISQYHSKMDDIENRLLNIRPDTFMSNSTNTTVRDQNMYQKMRRLDRRLVALQRAISSLKTLLTKDECASNPCGNGGVCLDMYNGFLCQCQSGWEGPTCEIDIDECTRFKGTDLGCQNGGTCQNLPGNFQCYCQNGWVGIHCNKRPIDCNSASSEICGHGTCIPQNTEAGYKCICDTGWTTDGTHKACSVDVDECKQNHPPCSTNPLVLCTNIPGSFVCQHCPPGYTGNGYYCADVNECELFNGGCSVSPFVECINTPGSIKCGPCPPGYQGDGKQCSYRGVCNVNNGGCSLVARCIENPTISENYVQCICPPGYAGTGMGPNGCYIANINSTRCYPNPCVHGTCMPNSSPQGFSCRCDQRYSGDYCDHEDDPCATNPCLNGGTCQKRRGKVMCRCPSGFSGKFCNKERQGCGESINSPNGTLTYPPTDYAFTRGSEAISCAWTITTDESMVIQINFTKFNILSTKTCSTQWFQIHDGRNSMAPPLGRYCGQKIPLNGSVTSTHNVIYFWLNSNGMPMQRPEFEITWTAKQPECGGIITEGSGMITSPGWPSAYPNNRNCYWHFKVPVTKRLLFHIYSLNIGHDPDCTGDFLEFYVTNSAVDSSSRIQYLGRSSRLDKQLFANFCNSTIPEPFYSTFSQGYVYFKSNDKDAYPGFQIGYSTVNGIPGCGGTYTNRDGYIQSIEITSSMPTPLTCVYEIKLPTNATIQLEIVEMNLEGSCRLTSIEIYQGSSTDSGLIGTYCGTSLPGPIMTFGSNILIKSTSTMYHKNHWKIKYESICTKRFTTPVGSISSTVESRECTYHIEQEAGNIVTLNLQLKGFFYDNKECIPYYVEVRDGDHENSTLIGRYCKVEQKFIVESSTNYLWIKSRLPPTRLTGFTANYTSMEMGCGGLLKKEPGTISFPPQDSGQYASNKKCRWVIMAPNDKVVLLTWMTFHVEQSFDCTYDHIEIFDNNTGDGRGGTMGKYCGLTLPPIMLSSSNVMTIDFTSDGSVHGDGFKASYTFIKENNVCGANYFTSAGVIKSPGYPSNYPANRQCIWVITVAAGSQIMLNVTDFNVEAYSSCRYDWLEIRNGGTSSSPLIGRYCGTAIPKLIPSHTNKLFLKFNSDMSRTAKGFNIQWSSAATGCGGTLTSPLGAIMSPHYPEPYPKNADCLWKIVVSAGSKVQIMFADVDLEKHSVCGLDFIQIFDGLTINSESIGKFCSLQTSPIISSANAMLVRFRSDVSFQGRGFNIQYSAICSNTLTGFEGVIESPNFPNDYPLDQNCIWDIVVADKNKINITFSHFALERSKTSESKNCEFDYVEIEYLAESSDDISEDRQYKKYDRYCGSTNPGLITLDSDHAKVHFVSDSLALGTGFRLEWKIFGCGGDLTEQTGTIMSPNYPKRYPPSVECNWVITVPLGQSINITFNKLDVEKDQNCNFDFVNLYNGKDASYPLLATFCHQVKPITVTSTGNNMFIQFKADASYQGTGFLANYHTEKTNCGGLLTAPSGYVFSPNYPKNYNKNETCEWLITTDEHHLIQLEFEDLDLVKMDCNKTYIKVYNGPTQAYPLLKTICGNKTPNETIKSTYEHLFIEFRSDNHLTSKGFQAKYQKACGATIKTSGSGILGVNREFIGTQMELGSCTYTIQAEDNSKHITLTITRMSNTGWCDEEYSTSVRIYNGPSSDSPLVGKYCGPAVPPPIVSEGSALHIEFLESQDFFATYSVLDNQCGGELDSLEGFFATPGWPKTYPNNIQCEWTISLGPGNVINVHFEDFDIPESDNCNTDFLEIREANATGKLLGVFCGTSVPSNLTAIGNMYFLFKSSHLDEGVATTNKGFKGGYATTGENKLNGSEGLIANPNYPRSTLQFGSYSWLITTKPSTRIEITFVDYLIERGYNEEDCSASPFKIFDGMDIEAEMLIEECNVDHPAPVLSSSNMVYITFDQYTSRLESKFLLKWKQLTTAKKNSPNTTSACQSVYTLDGEANQTITSPGYPTGYATSLNCEWIFETPPQYHIQIVFVDRDFGPSTGFQICTYTDVVRVSQKAEKNGKWDKLKEFCNNSNSVDKVLGTNLMKIEFQTNKYLNGTGFKAVVLAVCGGTLTEPSGRIGFNSTETECQWNITVKSGRTIKLKFEEFDLTPNDECLSYLIIRNGKFADSPYLGNGKFCGPDTPPEMESSSNHLYIKYASQDRVASQDRKRFKIYYEEVSINCGQQYQLSLEDTSVEVTSPNYPNVPPAHTECVWIFRAPTGEALRVDFEERFDISKDAKCTKDYLELRNGGTELAHLIGTYCTDTPSTQFTTDNMLRMKLFTDSDEPGNGFKAKVSIAYCGGTIKGTTGVLNTKEPHFIRAGSNCTWYLKAPMGYHLNITFTKFHVSHNTLNCTENDVSKVYIYERNPIYENYTTLGTYCGQIDTTSLITTSTNEAIVNYISKSDHDEFSLKFDVVHRPCGGELVQEDGTLTNSRYPRQINKFDYCYWQIRVPKGRRITFITEDIDFDSTYLVIANGYYIGPVIVFNTKDSIKTGETYESSDNEAHVVFWQNYQSNKRGFKLSFTSDKPTICVGNFNQSYGEILAPTGAKSYGCVWEHTRLTENETVAIKIAMESNLTLQNCLRANAGIQIFYKTYITNLCKNSSEKTFLFRSSYPTTTLKVNKPTSINLNFTISYKTYKCGGDIQNEQGVLSSPNFPNSPKESMECSWRLSTHKEHKIKINITNLNLGNDCDTSYLIIYNGNDANHPRIGKYCKNNKPELIITQKNEALIEYKYEEGGDGSSNSFSLSYEPEIFGCGGIYQYQKNIIQTPNYGKDYPNNAECLWEVHANDGYLVKLQFFDRFHIEQSDNCANDYVEIFDWKDNKWVSLGKKCGRNLPEEIVSSNTKLKILFRSNDKISESGFKAKWEWHCGGELEASKEARYLMNPKYPFNEKANCTYKIVARNANPVISIKFLDFNLPPDCVQSSLSLTTSGMTLGRPIRGNRQVYCGTNKPTTQRVQGKIVISYNNNITRRHWGEASGFKLVYKDESCGGNITSPTVIEVANTAIDTMQLRGMVRYYQPRILCYWYVTAPANQIAVLSIRHLGLSLSAYCFSQTLDVFNGLSSQQTNRIATLCGKIEADAKPIPSNSNTMLIKLDSAPYNFEGFQGEVYFTYGPSAGCGGNINLTETKLLNAPNTLPHMDCHWTIIAPKDHKVQLEFTMIKISGACNNPVRNHTYFCTCAFIEVRDGGGPFADLMSKLCSNDSNAKRTFTTSWNTAYLRLYSAVPPDDIMFSLTLKPVQSKCGPSELTVTKDLKELTSPDYPSTYPDEIMCTWVLKNPTAQGKVMLQFEDFDLLDDSYSQLTSSCDDDSIMVTDDPNRHIITEGYGPSAKYQVQSLSVLRLAYNKFSFCGRNTKPFDFYSVGNTVTLLFKSLPSGTKGRGFKLKYGALGCNRTINANEGRIQNTIQDANDCLFTITADKNRTISISFLSFYILYSSSNCTNFGLEIRENNSTGTQLLKACGYRVPNPVFSNSNQLYIRAYNKGGPSPHFKYDFLFMSSEYGKGCGGELFNFRGKFSSPLYPNPFREDAICTWTVRVPRDYKVALKFNGFDIVGACYKNQLIVKTYSKGIPSTHVFCSQEVPAILYSEVNLEVTYYSTINNGGAGWLASFQAIKDESDQILWF